MVRPLTKLNPRTQLATCFWGLLILFFLRAELSNSQEPTCDSADLKGLLGFSAGLDSGINGWNSNSSGSNPNCCNWAGISCDPDTGRVVKLVLFNQKLKGKISDHLGSLANLRTLNLSTNLLSGSVPSPLFNLPDLEDLDLSKNDLSGSLPATLNAPSLRRLNLSENHFTDKIPPNICSNLTKILTIDFSFNNFSGTIPPGLGNCVFLEELFLNSNYIAGNIPESIFRLSNLAQLNLADNRLSGQLSSGIGNLSNLTYFDVSANWFTGEIPDVFHGLTKLQDFSAQSNNFIGGIPYSLSNSRTLYSLILRNNSLNGEININCTAMTALVSLDLATNLFSGPFPDNLPLCPQLKTLNLARTGFNSEIPRTFSNFHSLHHLSLTNATLRNLSSALEILQHCKNLTTLVLTFNFHNEELPTDSTLRFRTLKTLIIANCKLTGSIPLWLRGSGQLQLLDLSWNHLGGKIPPWLGNFEFLFYVDLSNNSFVGEIPKNISQLKSLIHLNRSLEDTAQDFPFFLRRNIGVRGLQYNRLCSFPPTLEFGHNFLSGPIWAEFGNLTNVHVLDLKFNHFLGSIPSDLSGMKSIESLDLSHNNLSGTIPPSLVSLTFLSQFSVAFNHLEGVIPSGRQFATFPNSSFEGNPGLCGEHASACPTNNSVPQSSSRKPSKRTGVVVGMGVGIGLGSVFLLGLMFMIVLRASSRQGVDPERDEPGADKKNSEELGSKFVVFFGNKDKELSVEDLLKSTNNFDQANIIGCGGFGLVYKAILPDGAKLAVKHLTNECSQMEREFRAEIETLSRAQHPNLVLLQGYCNCRNDRLLIYSYMENGSLDHWLHEKPDGPCLLDWDTRLQISQGAARGLAYLHQSCEPRILHRDIKSSNILLDENFTAHLADFGLARLIYPYDTHVSTDLAGTLGYIPPEYSQAGVATYKGDVYSFGVVLLELLTGKRPMDMCKPKGSRDMISWVFQMRRERKESEVFDPFIYDKQHGEEMIRVLEIACVCLCECPKSRPSAQQLASWLDRVI